MRGTITIAPQTKKGYYTIQTHRGSHSIRLLVGVQNHGHGILLKWSKVVPPYPVVFIIRLPFLRLELASLSIFRHFSRWTSHAAAHHTLQILQHLVSSLCPLHPTSSCTCRIRSEHHLRRVVVLTTCQARCFLPVFATFRMLSEPLSLVRSCFNLRYHMCIATDITEDHPNHLTFETSKYLQVLVEHGHHCMPVYRSYERFVHGTFATETNLNWLYFAAQAPRPPACIFVSTNTPLGLLLLLRASGGCTYLLPFQMSFRLHPCHQRSKQID